MRVLVSVFLMVGCLGVGYGQSWEELNKKGEEAYSNGKYKEALAFLKIAKEQAEKEFGKRHKNYAQACGNLGMAFKEAHIFSKAKVLLIKAKNLYAKLLGKKHEKYALVCNNLATLYDAQGKYSKAQAWYVEAKNVYDKENPEQALIYAIVCNNLAASYNDQYKYLEAEKLYKEALGIRAKFLGKTSLGYAQFCENLAGFYKKYGKYEKAMVFFVEAKNIKYQKLGKLHDSYANSCNHIAMTLHDEGLYHKAELFYLEAKQIREKIFGKKHHVYASSCLNLALLYKKQGQYGKALKLCLDAMLIIEQKLGKRSLKYVALLNNLSGIYEDQRDYDKATKALKEAQNILDTRHPWYVRLLLNLGELYNKQGKYSEALPIFLKAQRILEQSVGIKHILYAFSCGGLGITYKNQKKYIKAELLLMKAKDIIEIVLGEAHPRYAVACSNLASLYMWQKAYIKTDLYYQKVMRNLQKQIRFNFLSLSRIGRNRFIKRRVGYKFELYNSFTLRYYDLLGIKKKKGILTQMYNNRLFIKSLLFRASQKTKERIYASGDTSLIDQYEQFIAKRVYYNKMQDLPKKQRKKRGVKLGKLNDEIEALEKNLARKSSEFAQELEEYVPHTWQEVKQKLKPGEAAIEMIRFRWYNKRWTDTVYYAALIVTPESQYPEPVFLTSGNFLEGKGHRYYQKNIGAKSRDVQSYQKFWQPIQQRLQNIYPQAKKLFVSLDGVYHRLNLETLWNPVTKQYLGEMIDIQMVSNTKDLLKRNPRQDQVKMTHQRAVLFGYPDYKQFNSQPLSAGNTQTPERYGTYLNTREKRALGDGFDGKNIPNLPHTKTEVQNVQKLLSKTLSSTAYLGKDATEENLKAVRNPAILHLATHGFFLEDDDLDRLRKKDQFRLGSLELKQYDANPLMRSGLVWTGAEATFKALPRPQNVQEDGVLTAQEVLNMTLDSTDLVVLSACETGKGKIESGQRVYGLQRAFLSAGAKNVLMSLWKVDDEATQWFMRYFYQDLIHHQNIRRAYRTAQQRLRKKYPAPYHWGAFVLVGK